MNPAVIYFSITGNTRKLANAAAEEINAKLIDVEAEKDININQYDLLLIGSGCYAAAPGTELVKFIKNNNFPGTKVIVFATYSILPMILSSLKKKVSNAGGQVIGEWGCKGQFMLLNLGRPNENDIREFKSYIKKTVEDAKI